MRRAVSILAPLALVTAACSGSGVSTTAGAGPSSTTPNVGASGAPSAVELSSTHEITGFGFTIDYPSGWFAETLDTVTGIAELKGDLEQALVAEGPQPYTGVTILLDHRSLSFMESLGLPSEDPTSEDLLDLNIGFFGWTDIVDRPQVTLFGVPAVVVQATARSGQPVLAVQAVRADEGDIFILSLQAPSVAALEEALPTWEAILASVTTATSTTASEEGLTGTFDVGGLDMFVTCAGTGSPTVVLEAPLGTSSGIWGDVLPAVAEFTQVCAYDRAGLGASDSAPKEIARSGSQMVEDLRSLLTEAGIDGPYVVAGHSFGGLLVRLFANDNPDVAGVVLIESSHPDQIARFADLFGETTRPESDSNLEEVDMPAVAAEAGTVASLGSIPLVVLSRGQPQTLGPGASAELTTQAEELWQALQSDLVGLSTNSAQLIAENSGHNVPVEEPDTVVEAIELLIEHLRSPDTPLETP